MAEYKTARVPFVRKAVWPLDVCRHQIDKVVAYLATNKLVILHDIALKTTVWQGDF